MPKPLSAGVRRWIVSSIAVPFSAKALTSIADRLERAEGRASLMSRGLRTASKVARRERPQKDQRKAPGRTER